MGFGCSKPDKEICHLPPSDYSFSLLVLVDNLDEYFTSTLGTLIVLPTHPFRLLSAKDLFACRQVNASRLTRRAINDLKTLHLLNPSVSKAIQFLQKTPVFHPVREFTFYLLLGSCTTLSISQNEQICYCIGTKDSHFPASHKVCLGERSSFEHCRLFALSFSVAILCKCHPAIHTDALSQTIWPWRSAHFQRCF